MATANQEMFAEKMETVFRKKWPKATVRYTGGGWFTYSANEYPLQPHKMRSFDLQAKAATLEWNLANSRENSENFR